MIYISKTNQTAITFVSNFLISNWLEQNNGNFKYQNIGYAQVKNPVNVFRGFFVSEQDYKCCYCCKTIENNNSTELEHIIPKSKSTTEEFQLYYALSNILRDNIVPQNNFESSNVQLNLPPYPHHIAYHNIVASCNGRSFDYSISESFTCCNRKREDEFVPPFNLMQNSISYLNDGTIVYLIEPKNRKYFEILNLDKKLLNQVRRLWFLFSESILSIDEILNDNYTKDITEKIVAYAIAYSDSPIEDSILTETFSNINIWSIFKTYKFFFEYYRNNK